MFLWHSWTVSGAILIQLKINSDARIHYLGNEMTLVKQEQGAEHVPGGHPRQDHIPRGSALLFQKVVPSYRVPVLRELYNRFGIVTCHSTERRSSTWRSFLERMDFPHKVISKFAVGSRESNVVQNVFSPIHQVRPNTVLTEFSVGYLSFWLIFMLKLIYRYKLVVWTHGVHNSELRDPFKTLKSKIELFIFRRADAVVLYSEFRKVLLESRVEPSKLFVAANTLDVAEMSEHRKMHQSEGVDQVKQRLGYKQKYNLVYLGRLLPDKRIDLLLEVFDRLRPHLDIALHLIGDGPERERVEAHSELNLSLFAHGSVFDEEILGSHLYVSDLVVNPGYVGLSIVHGFAYATPLVTCTTEDEGPFHSPEVEYLRHDVNGIYCDGNPDDIADRIKAVLTSPQQLADMKTEALKTAEHYSLANMIDGVGNALNYLDNERQ